MNIFSFTAHFGSEEDCRLHFKEQRDKEGVVCKRCGGTSHYWLQGKWSYECKGCRFRTSLRSGTIMESSKLPFLVWYKTMFLMSCTKKGFSTNELQKQLGLKRSVHTRKVTGSTPVTATIINLRTLKIKQ